MPPMYEDQNHGVPRAPIRQAPKPTRGGLLSAEAQHIQSTYNSPYVASRGPLIGGSASTQQPLASSSDASWYKSMPYGRVEPEFDMTLQPAHRLAPPYQISGYQPLGSSSQRAGGPSVPYQVQRSPQFQEQGSAQAALSSALQARRSSIPYGTQAAGRQEYRAPYSTQRIESSSGHGHDFTQSQPQYRQQPSQNPPYQQQVTSYSSPYFSSATQNGASARQPPRTQPYASSPMQVAIPSYRHTQHQPSLSQNLLPTIESSIYPSTSPSPASSPGPSNSRSRRGRPPGSTNKSKLAVEVISTPIKSRRLGRPSRDSLDRTPNSSAPPSNTNSLPRKRGRPFKSTEAAAKAKAKASQDVVPKKRGRPFKIRDQLEIPIPEAMYVPFLCEWKGCQAELHNLETLRMHVVNVHGKKNGYGVRVCAWGKCGIKIEAEEVDENSKAPIPEERKVEFKSKKAWMEHMEKEHLVPFAWHMGDGPKATSLELKKPATIDPWLLDEDGNQVTPSVANQTIEAGIARVNNARRWAKEQRKLNITVREEKPTGPYMKTQAQIVQEEDAETGSGDVETNEDMETGMSTGDEVDTNENENERGNVNDREMERGDDADAEGENENENEGEGEDSGADVMILDDLF
ncbi:hypothetical protein EG329_011252 [Mollisiaceae sp. DMI_Dod_QoI]|nr:hypothetical protein EG329_011252 [Helotiales sp. DMI_Dod_QoI]